MNRELFMQAVRENVVVAIVGMLGVVTAAIVAASVSYFAARTELDGKLVEIGVGILTAKPDNADAAHARAWAIELVERHSGLAFTEEAKRALQTQTSAAGAAPTAGSE